MMQAATPRRRLVAMAALTLCAIAATSSLSTRSPAAAPIAVAVADFDYFDTSGEVADQSAEHQARVASFANLLRDNLAALTAFTQRSESLERVDRLIGTATYRTSRYAQLVFRVVDSRGDLLSDYDLLLTAGPEYSPDELPAVTVPPSPKGLPTATTQSPTRGALSSNLT